MFYAVLVPTGKSTILVNRVETERQMRSTCNTINKFGGSAMNCVHANKKVMMKVIIDNPILNWMGYKYVDHRKLTGANVKTSAKGVSKK